MAMIDLSRNESPYEPLPAVRRAVREAAQCLSRYPDRSAAAVVAALTRTLDLQAAHIVVGSGSAAVGQHLIQALGPERAEVVHPALSSGAYPLIVRNAGARPVPVPMAGHRPDLAAMAAAVTADTRCVLLGNPNDPTGAVLRRAEVEEFTDALPPDVVVIVDEAYHEFVTDPDVPDGLRLHRGRDNVCVLRTFSQAYGLASLRIGYAVAPPALAAAARTIGTMHMPGGLAQAAAVAALDPSAEHEVAARCAELAATRVRLRNSLIAAGLVVAPSEANFLWLPLGARATAFARRCRESGVLVRAYPGLGVRVTVGTAAQNERLLQAVRATVHAPGVGVG